eukprot:5462856-Pleurochrysis_carterae.AAC.2
MVGGSLNLLSWHMRRLRARCEERARGARSRANGLVTEIRRNYWYLLAAALPYYALPIHCPVSGGLAMAGGGSGGIGVAPSPDHPRELPFTPPKAKRVLAKG